MDINAIIDKLIDALSNSVGLALVGASFLLFAAVSLLKLAIAISQKCNTKAAFASKPPRDAFAGKTIWISGASSGYGRALALHLLVWYGTVLYRCTSTDGSTCFIPGLAYHLPTTTEATVTNIVAIIFCCNSCSYRSSE